MKRVFALLLVATIVLALDVGAGGQTGGTFLSFVSDPGDFVGQGRTLFLTPETSSFQSRAEQNNRVVSVFLFPFNSADGLFWFLDLAAPQGQQLVPGVYEGATRYPFQTPGEPGISFVGDGRGCNTATGRFQVFESVYGPAGYVERFRADFEQHCEGGTPALRGTIQIVNPPPPQPLALTVTVNGDGSVDRITGMATVSGTLSCSAETTANLFGILRQRANRFALASGSFSSSMTCSATLRQWSAEISSSGVPFNPGHAQLDLTANAFDPNFGNFVTKEVRAIVRLNRSRP